jgi:type IV pilus assembly protein PilY1
MKRQNSRVVAGYICGVIFVLSLVMLLPVDVYAAKTLTVNISGTGRVLCEDQSNITVFDKTVSGTASVDNTAVLSCTLTPGVGFILFSPTPSPVTVSMNNASQTLSVVFKPSLTVTATVSGSGGTASPASQSVASGATATVTITPDAVNLYAVQSIRINSGTNTLSQPSYSAVTQSVGPVISNTTVVASFVRYHQINVTQPANCTILYNGSIPLGGVVKVIDGDTATFSIIPATGATINQVTYNGTSQGVITSFTTPSVTADNNTLTATCTLPVSDMYNYVVTPPFISGNPTPNLLLMIDNSASMYDMAHDATGKCYDTTFNPDTWYPGYFDNGYYNKATEAIVWSTNYYNYNATAGRFESGATMPSSCTFKSADYCVVMSGTKPNRTVSNFIATGNFLNWLATSKLDLQKKILTGGKYDSASGTLLSESRGCSGRRFVRIVPNIHKVSGSAEDLDQMTFAIRGPTSFEADYTNPATQGGATRIEIYDAQYNLAACSAAVDDWTDVDEVKLGEIQKSTTDCLACQGTNCSTSSVLKSETYVHMVHDCYWYYNEHKLANLQTFKKDCENIYTSVNTPSQIVNELSGEAVCSSVIPHPEYSSLLIGGYTYVPNTTGFLGKCVTLTEDPVHPGQFSYTWDDTCLNIEGADFCEGMRNSDVTDPSTNGTVTTGVSSSVPSFVIDAGVNALGSLAGSYYANVRQNSAPEGLINDFTNKIRFGAMVFNQDGTGAECNESGINIKCAGHCSTDATRLCYSDAECGGASCVLNTKTDGGKVISYIGYDPVGNHSGGLIKAIDDIQATAWTPWAEAYYNAIGYFANRADLRLQEGDFVTTKNPTEDSCRLNNILIISDGGSTADQNASVYSLAATYNDGDGKTDSITSACGSYAGSRNLDDLAWLAYNKNITDFTKTPVSSSEKIKTYVAYNGLPATDTTDECLPANLMDQTAKNGGTATTDPSLGNDYLGLLRKIYRAFSDIAGGAASGTAASILSNSEGSGANILQAVFYPLKEFAGETSAAWIGEMQNLWYYVDPYIANSSVREDTYDDGTVTGVELDVKKDYVVQFVFDSDTNQTNAKLYQDTDGDGDGDIAITSGTDSRVNSAGVLNADDVKSIWRAGKLLWGRNVTTDRRELLTYLYGATADGCTGSFSKTGLVDLVLFNWAESTTNSCILQKHLNASTQTEAENIIKYMNGIDGLTINGVTSRNRTVNIGGVSKVWKLGDIISSTPRVQSSNKLQNYHQDPPIGYADATYANDTTGTGFANSASYKDRGMVYTGANDGMLHAFNMGKLNVQTTGDTKAILTGSNLGREEWAFIPRHALPYLKYLADPNYAHLYLIDGPTKIVDASIGAETLSGTGNYQLDGCGAVDAGDVDATGATIYNYWSCKRDAAQTGNTSWRTVLIGSMGTGGASVNSTATCDTSTECVKTPVNGIGFSTYYALDITDPNNPKYLWEFKDDQMGFSTTGTAVVRIAHQLPTGERDTNGRWLVVIGNGPTGPIDVDTHQFKGRSIHDLRLFALDMRDGTLLKKFTPSTSISNAFVGSIAPGPQDINRTEKLSSSFYSDDVVYAGYTQCTANCSTATPTWDGGVLRLVTKDTAATVNKNSIYPKNWELTTLLSGVGPVTSAVARLQDRKNKKLWLFLGTGRYFYKDDDQASQGKLVGVMEPCFVMDNYGKSSLSTDSTCKATIPFSSGTFIDQTTLVTTPDFTGMNGWYITLAEEDFDNDYGAERVITDPVAMPNGAVFFTTFMPSTSVCNFGGNSYLWGVKYDTGGVASSSSLQGKALVQVSTGSFEEVNLGAALSAEGGRKMGTPMVGKPPTDPPPIVSGAGNKPLKRIIHVREK